MHHKNYDCIFKSKFILNMKLHTNAFKCVDYKMPYRAMDTPFKCHKIYPSIYLLSQIIFIKFCNASMTMHIHLLFCETDWTSEWDGEIKNVKNENERLEIENEWVSEVGWMA